MNVLVVDDVAAIGMIVSRIAAQGGWHSYYTDQVGTVIDTIRDKKIDVVLCDYFMPEAQGIDVLRNIRESGLHLPVVFFTGHAEGVDLEAANKLGLFKVLSKPLSIAELRTTLNEAYRTYVKPVKPKE